MLRFPYIPSGLTFVCDCSGLSGLVCSCLSLVLGNCLDRHSPLFAYFSRGYASGIALVGIPFCSLVLGCAVVSGIALIGIPIVLLFRSRLCIVLSFSRTIAAHCSPS